MALSSVLRGIFGGCLRPTLIKPHMSQFGSVRFRYTVSTPKLMVCGVPRDSTDEDIRKAFEPLGNVVEAKIAADSVTGKCRGFGYITFETVEEARKAQIARAGTAAKFLGVWIPFYCTIKPWTRWRQSSAGTVRVD
ncbi:unnamed protein product [Cuscuta campestris]|uniref:RRM domain-containing protein n=1 Tax=Cuscuta campestris TaxID=132261 RepID=A0A484NQE3_9ASTE|nr:unnamed protein product [Cuscuta campestris]